VRATLQLFQPQALINRAIAARSVPDTLNMKPAALKNSAVDTVTLRFGASGRALPWPPVPPEMIDTLRQLAKENRVPGTTRAKMRSILETADHLYVMSTAIKNDWIVQRMFTADPDDVKAFYDDANQGDEDRFLPRSDLREVLAKAVGSIKDSGLKKAWIKLFANDNDPDVTMQAADQLRTFRNQADLDEMAVFLSKHPNGYARLAALELLDRVGLPHRWNLMKTFMEDPRLDSYEAAVNALPTLTKDPATLKMLTSYYNDWQHCQWVTFCLDPEVIPDEEADPEDHAEYQKELLEHLLNISNYALRESLIQQLESRKGNEDIDKVLEEFRKQPLKVENNLWSPETVDAFDRQINGKPPSSGTP
jgi:hypothetical protein